MTEARKKPERRWLRRIALLLTAVLLVGLLQYLYSRATARSRAVGIHKLQDPAAPASAELRLLTFNIAHGRGTNDSNWSTRNERNARLQQIAALLKEQQADIVVLNEVDFDSSWSGYEDQGLTIGRAAGFAGVVEQRNFDVALPFFRLRFGNAILTRHKILSAQFVELPARSDWENRAAGSKQGLYADIQLTTNLTVRVFAVHTEYRDEATRVRCAEAILAQAKASPHPFLCIGDFNSSPSGFPGAEKDGSGSSLMDVLLKTGLFKTLPTGQPTPDQWTFPSWQPNRTIDWILVPASWEITKHEVLRTDLSDHCAVAASVISR